MKSWDMGVPYEDLKALILRKLSALRDKRGVQAARAKAYLVIYAIQLRNGARISEAAEAFRNFCRGEFERQGNVRITRVKTRKKKKPEERLVVFPSWLPWTVVSELSVYRLPEASSSLLSHACRRLLGVNTHTLRYAFVTYLGRRGVAPQLIAQITHHSDLKYVLRYTQQAQAEKILSGLED